MAAVREHSDYVYKVAHQPSAAASSPIAASWRRCMTLHGLAPEEGRQPLRLSGAEFELARQRSAELILKRAVNSTGCSPPSAGPAAACF